MAVHCALFLSLLLQINSRYGLVHIVLEIVLIIHMSGSTVKSVYTSINAKVVGLIFRDIKWVVLKRFHFIHV